MRHIGALGQISPVQILLSWTTVGGEGGDPKNRHSMYYTWGLACPSTQTSWAEVETDCLGVAFLHADESIRLPCRLSLLFKAILVCSMVTCDVERGVETHFQGMNQQPVGCVHSHPPSHFMISSSRTWWQACVYISSHCSQELLLFYLAVPGFSCSMRDIPSLCGMQDLFFFLSCGMWTLSYGMWDLVPWPGIKPRLPFIGSLES